MIEPGWLVQVEHALGLVVGRSDPAATGALALELFVGSRESEVGVAQEDQPEHGRRVLRRAQARVRSQAICSLP